MTRLAEILRQTPARLLLKLLTLLLLLPLVGHWSGLSTAQAQEIAAAVPAPPVVTLTEGEQAWLNDHPDIPVGIMADWPPISFLDPTGNPVGISADIAAALNRRLGGHLQLKSGPWDGLMAALEGKRLDAVLDFTPTPEQSEEYLFTTAYLDIPHVIVGKQGRSDLKTEESLRGKTLALERGFANVGYFRQQQPETRIREYSSTKAALGAVATGEADAYAGNRAVAIYLMQKEVITNLAIYGQLNQPGSVLAMGVRKERPILRDILQKALDSIPEEEKIRILDKWVQVGQVESTADLTGEERAWLHAHPVLRIGIDPSRYPFEYFDEKGKYRGMVADYKSLIELYLGIRLDPQAALSWRQVIRRLGRGELDVVAGMTPTPARRERYLFTDPYIKKTLAVFTQLESPDYKSLNDLAGKVMALPRDTVQWAWVKRDYPLIELLPVDSVDEALKAVATGNADAFLGDVLGATHSVNRQALTNLRVNFESEYRLELAYAVSKNLPELVPILNKALAAIDPETHRRIQEKWQAIKLDNVNNELLSTQVSLTNLLVWFACFLVALLLLIIVYRRLSRGLGSRFFETSKLWRLGLLPVAAFLAFILLVAWLAFARMDSQLRKEMGQTLVTVNQSVNHAMELWLESRIREIYRVAIDDDLIPLVQKLLKLARNTDKIGTSDELQKLREFYRFHTAGMDTLGFFLVAPDRSNLASMRNSDIGSRNLLAERYPELLNRVFSGESLFFPPLQVDVPAADRTSDVAEQVATMFFATPVRDTFGRIIAVLCLRLDPVSEFTPFTRVVRVGESGESYAFDKNARLLTPYRLSHFQAEVPDQFEGDGQLLGLRIADPGGNLLTGYAPFGSRDQWPLTRMAADALAGNSGLDTAGYRDYRGVKVIGAWLWSDKLGIGLATEIDFEEAFAPYHAMRLLVLGALVGITLLALALTAFIVWLGERSRASLELLVDKRTDELSKSEERFRTMVESATDAIFIHDKRGLIRDVNNQACVATGYQREELIGMSIKNLDISAQNQGLEKIWANFEKIKNLSIEGRHRRKDASEFPVEVRLSQYLKDDKVFIMASARDITERKRAEETLRQQERHLRTIIDNLPSSVALKALDGRYLMVNAFFEQATGNRGDDIIGLTDADFLDADMSDEIMSVDREILESGQRRTFEETIPHPDGTVHSYLTTKVPLQDENNTTYCLVVLAPDITERKKTEEA